MKTLFIGNSYTMCNDLPSLFAGLAVAGDIDPAASSGVSASGGKNLKWHWHDGPARSDIESEHWDTVVLQDHSMAALEAPESLAEYGGRFVELIRSHGAAAVFYVTWAREYAPETQSAITAAYASVAQRTGSSAAPIGPAWQNAIAAGGPRLYVDDHSHPSLAGTYLAACVFVATVYGCDKKLLSTTGIAAPETGGMLSERDSVLLQRVAWETVRT
ncbi:MAG: hypothetical protein JW909_09095 [Planctomycetes bacterium]|nr:hypothetical protein [Planctomycetota bacterium]